MVNGVGWTLPSPARHGGCTKERNRRAACPLPGQGRGIWMLPDRSFTCVSDRSKEAEELHNLPVSTHSLLPATSVQDTPRAGLRTRDCARGVRLSRAANNDPHPRAPGALALSLKRARDLNYCSANHSDSSGLARSLALSFSRVAAARRIPVLPHRPPAEFGIPRARQTRARE